MLVKACLRYHTRGRTKTEGTKNIRAVQSLKVRSIAVDTALLRLKEGFNEVIGEECSHKNILWVYTVCLHIGCRRIEMSHAFAVATSIFILMMYRALLFGSQIIFQTNHPFGMMMMGYDGHHQHNDADEEKKYVNSPFLFHIIIRIAYKDNIFIK